MNFILLTIAILAIQIPILVKAQPTVADPREIILFTQILAELQTLSDNIRRLLLLASSSGNNRNNGALNPAMLAILAATMGFNRGDDNDRQPSVIKIPSNSYKSGSYGRLSQDAKNEQASQELQQYFNDLMKKKVNKRTAKSK